MSAPNGKQGRHGIERFSFLFLLMLLLLMLMMSLMMTTSVTFSLSLSLLIDQWNDQHHASQFLILLVLRFRSSSSR